MPVDTSNDEGEGKLEDMTTVAIPTRLGHSPISWTSGRRRGQSTSAEYGRPGRDVAHKGFARTGTFTGEPGTLERAISSSDSPQRKDARRFIKWTPQLAYCHRL